MSGHTPGLWASCSANNGNCDCGYIFGDGNQVYVAKVIGLGDEVDPYPSESQRRANIRLIRSAPAMHVALQEAAALIEGWNAGANEEDVKRTLGVINFALAQANGEG